MRASEYIVLSPTDLDDYELQYESSDEDESDDSDDVGEEIGDVARLWGGDPSGVGSGVGLSMPCQDSPSECCDGVSSGPISST